MTNQKSFIVYKHTNLINQKVYIGITKTSPNRRWGSNGINYRHNKHFYSAIQKYGWNNFKHEILFNNLNKEDACKIEKQLIFNFNSNNPKYGYNNSIGGELSALGCHFNHTQETKNRLQNFHCKPIICLDTLEIFNSIKMASKKFNIDSKFISQVVNKKQKSCHGLHFLFLNEYDSKQQYDLSNKKQPIKCIETNQTFNSICECAKQMNLSKGTIGLVLKGKRKSYKGLHFKYIK